MTPAEAAPFVVPSLPSTLAFVVIVFGVVTAVLVGLVWGERDPATARQWRIGGGFMMLAWLAITAAVPASGVLESAPLAVMVLPMGSLIAAFAVAASSAGARLASLPLGALVAFHVRLPLEVVLHTWYEGGSLPVQMTWDGDNLDVITGVLAVALSAVSATRDLPRWMVWGFNLVGLGLLVNVARNAATSTPTPLRQYLADPPVWLPYHPPYAWIVSVCVAGALLGHLVIFLLVIANPPSEPTEQLSQEADQQFAVTAVVADTEHGPDAFGVELFPLRLGQLVGRERRDMPQDCFSVLDHKALGSGPSRRESCLVAHDFDVVEPQGTGASKEHVVQCASSGIFGNAGSPPQEPSCCSQCDDSTANIDPRCPSVLFALRGARSVLPWLRPGHRGRGQEHDVARCPGDRRRSARHRAHRHQHLEALRGRVRRLDPGACREPATRRQRRPGLRGSPPRSCGRSPNPCSSCRRPGRDGGQPADARDHPGSQNSRPRSSVPDSTSLIVATTLSIDG